MARFDDVAVTLLQAQSSDPKLLTVPLLVILVMLALWRRLRYHAWPTETEYPLCIACIVGIYNALVVMLVMGFTHPPRTQYLAPLQLTIVGIYTMVLTLYYAAPKLYHLFCPESPALPPPPLVAAAGQTPRHDHDARTKVE